MRWALLPLLLASALPLSAVLIAAEAPRIEVDPERRLVLTGLPPILADDGVKEHLTTGLTTSITFLPSGKLPGGAPGGARGGARVDVRYDLWDEVFHLASAGHGQQIQHAEAASFEDLLAWWRTLRLVIFDGNRLPDPWPDRLKVTADVVPFSRSEQSDTRRWFSESIDRAAESGTGEVGRAGEQPTDGLSRTFNLLLATSIRRRALASYPWTLTLPPDPGRKPEDPP